MFVSSFMSVRVAVRVAVRVSLSTLFDRENKYLYVCVGTSCTNQCIAPLRIIPRYSMTHGTLGGTLHVASGSLLLPLHVRTSFSSSPPLLLSAPPAEVEVEVAHCPTVPAAGSA